MNTASHAAAAAAAAGIADQVGERLRSLPDLVAWETALPTGYPDDAWQPASTTGYPGIAFLQSRLAAVGAAGADQAAYQLLVLGKRQMAIAPGNHGPHFGPGAVTAAALHAAAHTQDPDRFRSVTDSGTAHLANQTLTLARRSLPPSTHGPRLPWRAFDAMTGLPLRLRVLVQALALPPGLLTQPTCRLAGQAIHEALHVLARLQTEPADGLPAWWVPGDEPDFPEPETSGWARTGLAHGAAGALAALALAHKADWRVPGQEDAMRTLVAWLLRWNGTTGDSSWWPTYVSGTELLQDAPAARRGRQDAWCYGLPGISRAICLAGWALADPVLSHHAIAQFGHFAARPLATLDVDGPTVCHGHAGLLQIATRMAADTGDVRARHMADRLAEHLAAGFDPAALFGYRHWRAAGQNAEKAWVDSPGMLTGAAGVALALTDYAHGPTDAGWDQLLLIA
ncbi:lanthionine synthetase LanC family protein [Streptomyces chryseus]